jgi:ISXO2-like transposase domain
MLQRGGEVVIRMLENVKQATIGPLIDLMIVKGTLVYTDEYDIYSRLVEWGYEHETVCHAAGEYARDDDGDGFCEVHVNVAVQSPIRQPSRRLRRLEEGRVRVDRPDELGSTE